MTRRCLAVVLLLSLVGYKVEAQPFSLTGRWHVGLEFGEIPFHGSFKPGLVLGYHVSELMYVGVLYQIRDKIQRNNTSFNARAIDLDGLRTSSEQVGQRGYLQVRVRPHRLSPFASLGLVFNDRDTEMIMFDTRARLIHGEVVDGALVVTQSRPSGWRPALGLGYSYTFPQGIEVFTEWAGWWLFGAPTPDVTFSGAFLSETTADALRDAIEEEFTSSPFNTYHVFQLGVGYNW